MSQQNSVFLPVGYALTLTANATSAGTYAEIGNPGDAPSAYIDLAAGASIVLGPFNAIKNYALSSNAGVMGYVFNESGIFTAADEAVLGGDFSSKQDGLSGLSITSATVTTGDLVLIQDVSNANNLKTVSAQSIGDLKDITGKQDVLSGASLTGATVAGDDKILLQDTSNSNNLKTVTAQSIADLVVGSTEAATLQTNIDLKAPIDGPQFTSGVTLLSGANLAVNNGGALVLGAPTGSSKGDLVFVGVDNTAAYDVVVQNAAHGQSSTYTIPDVGASTDAFVMKAANDIELAKNVKIINITNVGVANTGSTAAEHGDGFNNVTILTVNTTLPAITGGADQGLGKLLYTLPAGAVVIDKAYISMAITQTDGNINADTPDVGLGTAIASGTINHLDDTAQFEDIITGQTASNCTGTAVVKTIANQVLVIESGDAHTIHFNVADGFAADGDAAAILAGTVVLHWQFMH